MREPDPSAVARSFNPLWSQQLASAARGVVLAREKGWILAWDESGWLYLFNHAGVRQGQIRLSSNLVCAACAEDGSAYAAIGSQGELVLLAQDLTSRWQKTLPAPLLSLAIDPFGQYVVAADARGGVHVFDLAGGPATTLQSPRPLHHLAFVPAAAAIVASADYALVGAFDLRGEWLWRDGLVAHVGGLAVSGDGSQLLLACFSEGLRRYDKEGKVVPALSLPESCRLVAQAYDGGVILAAGLNTQLWLVDRAGTVLATYRAGQAVVGLALGAQADVAVLALADGSIATLALTRPA